MMVSAMKDLSNHYKLHILSSGDYECLVVCLSYESIFSYMNELKADMRKHNIKKGNILFDQLLICGNGKNRFLSVEIEDGDILQATAKNVVADQYYHELTASELRS